MSLATRCTACGTIFKVVQDQLKVSEGWVRCGRCQTVFNALEGLFDLERDPPPQRRNGVTPPPPNPAAPQAPQPAEPSPSAFQPTQPPAAPQAAPGFVQPPSPPQAEPSAEESWPQDVPDTYEDDALDSRWLVRPARDGRSAKERRHRFDSDSDFSDAQFPLDAAYDPDDPEADLAPPAPPPASAAQRIPMPPIPAPGKAGKAGKGGKAKTGRKAAKTAKAEDDDPEFVKRARRRAQWRHPAVRATLSLAGLTLLLLLALQASVALRNWIAAYHPAATPWLAQLCDMAGCKIEPLQRIEVLSVDSVSLLRSAATSPQAAASASAAQADASDSTRYRLNVVLRNRAPVRIAAPHLELSLTDANGSLVARKVLSPADFAYSDSELPAAGTASLELMMTSLGGRIAGYTVELFYP